MQGNLAHLSQAEIARRLAVSRPGPSDPPHQEHSFPPELLPGPPRPAAVLIPFLRKDGQWHILFTRRTSTLPEHSGQVAFPGGRADPGELTPETTALREAHEEIGLNPQDVRVLGRLKSFLTVTNYQVTPVVGAIPWPYPFHLATEEVSRVFTIPLDWLADPIHYEERLRDMPSPYDPVPVIYFQPYDNEILWGASARITLELLDVLKSGSTESS